MSGRVCIDAEWQTGRRRRVKKACIWQRSSFMANNRTGLLVDITKIFTERKIDVNSVNSRTSKQGLATIAMAFEVPDKAVLNSLIEKIRQVESVIDIERTTG